MRQFIYADNAATTKLDIDAFEAMKPYLLDDYGNPSQPYFFAKTPKSAVKKARETIAECIGAEPEQVFFTSGGTESDNWAIKGSAFFDSDRKATITSTIEHHAVLNACAAIERLGYSVAYLPVDEKGIVSENALKATITGRTRLVSIMLVNNELGSIEPIKELAAIAHKHGALFHTDAVQALGHIPVNVNELDVDMLSASAHKFNGPKGVGFLYNRVQRIYPHNDGGAQEFGMRAGTENVAGIVGMAAALKKNCDALEANQKHLLKLEKRLLSKLYESNIDFVCNGSGRHLPGFLSLSFKGCDGEALLHRLDLMGICVSTGAACDTQNTQVSHVLKAIRLDETYAKGTIRISLGKDTTSENVDRIVQELNKILQ